MNWFRAIFAQTKEPSLNQIGFAKGLMGNWYQRLKFAQLQGEFWIQGGQAMFADGDIGDYNHEGMAIETAQHMISDGEDWDQWKKNAAQEKFQEALQQATTPQLKKQ